MNATEDFLNNLFVESVELTAEEEQLLVVAKRIIAYYAKKGIKLLLSGSLSLKIQGIDIGRKVHDIDLCGESIGCVDDLESFEETHLNPGTIDYEDTDFLQGVLKLNGKFIKIDLLKLNIKDYKVMLGPGIGLLDKATIISYKARFVFSQGGNPDKHKRDLMYILLNN